MAKVLEAEVAEVIEEPILEPEVVAEDAGNPPADPPAPVVEGEDEVIVTIGEEAPPPEEEHRAPEWVRELRRKHRETVKELESTKKRLESLTAEPKPAELAKKPTLEDFDYDADRFESALNEWFEAKRKHDEDLAKAKAAEDAQAADWQAKLDSYGKAKAELKFNDFDEAEAETMEAFNVTQQGIIVQGSDNPALVVYALGKNPEQRKKLMTINDPVKFAFAVAKLEAQLKVTNRKAAPPPEKVVTGSGRMAGAIDSTLERLRAEAEKTGDYTKVMQYKRNKAKE